MECDNNLDILAKIIVYNQIRQHEEGELIESLFKVICGNPRL
jgi:hypothetical protein